MAETVRVSSDGPVRTVTLDRVAAANALDPAMLDALVDAFSAEPPDGERVTVLRAEGKVFCAGLDLRKRLASDTAEWAGESPVERAFHAVETYPLPVVAVVQGDAIAGGCELALHCDLVVASTKASFGMSLAQVGLAPTWFLAKKLLEVAGPVVTREVLLLGDPLPASMLRAARRYQPGCAAPSPARRGRGRGRPPNRQRAVVVAGHKGAAVSGDAVPRRDRPYRGGCAGRRGPGVERRQGRRERPHRKTRRNIPGAMMAVRMTKPFQALSAEAVARLPGQLGVFELADSSGVVTIIGFAGGREPFGVRSALEPYVGRFPQFRWEATSAYLTRWQELCMVHIADHGSLPPDQPASPQSFGRLSPL